MSLTKTVGFVAVTTLAMSGAAFGAELNNDMQSQIAELKAEIAALKGAEGGQWLTEQRAAEIRGIVTDVLADADTRSSLQGAAAGSGYNGGFFLSSADGNYSMKINVLEQIRYSFNHSESGATTTEASGFENKRTRLSFGGNVVDSTWSYKLSYYLGYSNSNENFGASELADASVTKDFNNGFTVTVGQFKLPFSAEYGMDVANLQFNEYSIVNHEFSIGYGQGIAFGYNSDQFRVAGAYVNAANQVNEAWNGSSPDTDWTIAARAEFKISGDWAQFNDAQSWKGEGAGMMAGLGYAGSADDTTDANASELTVDFTADFGGANIAAAYYWADPDDGSGSNPTGYTLSAGAFVADDCEIVARYEAIDNDAGTENGFFTLGANWYMAKNSAKVGIDFGYSMDDLAGGAGDYLFTNMVPADDGEWVIQAQMSLSF